MTFHAPSKPSRISYQNAIVRLLTAGPATSQQVAEVGGLSYTRRISELREQGYSIVVTPRPGSPGVNEYHLVGIPGLFGGRF